LRLPRLVSVNIHLDKHDGEYIIDNQGAFLKI